MTLQRTIDGQTQLVGLIGWPVEHSLSPAMHNAAFAALDLNWRYVPLPVPPGRMESAVAGLAALGFRGANVTGPHKRAALGAVDQVAAHAAAMGAVNTLVVEEENGGVTGYNTDGPGFVAALRQAGFDPTGKAVAVAGAGGAARAVVSGLLEAGAERVTVLNRGAERARKLIADLGCRLQDGPRLEGLALTPGRLVETARAADLLVNATPVGMGPNAGDDIWPPGVPLPAHLAVFDLVYTPLETRLLRRARESGARPIDGLGMLVAQGALAFERWTGRKAPVEVMRAACLERLTGASPCCDS